MNVKELIEKLSKLDPDMQVNVFPDTSHCLSPIVSVDVWTRYKERIVVLGPFDLRFAAPFDKSIDISPFKSGIKENMDI